MAYSDIILSIKCNTYNHEPYIAQCLEGFVMQKTNFQFEVLVHDDASTDKTADIVHDYERRYPDVIKPIYEIENQWSKHDGSLTRIQNSRIKGKYIAICEGDDYWTDPNKLQKQVDFMEANPEYGMCYTQVRVFLQQEKCIDGVLGDCFESFDSLLKKNVIPTLSVCMRTIQYFSYLEDVHPEKRGWLMGDYPIWLWISYNSKVKFMPFVSGVYRLLRKSASHTDNIDGFVAFRRSTNDITNYYINRYGKDGGAVFDMHRARFYYFLGQHQRELALSEVKMIRVRTRKEKIYLYLCHSAVIFCIASFFLPSLRRSPR